MTYQSSPYYPIIFPDQAALLNRFGVQPLPANYIKHAHLAPASHEAHPSWRADAHRLALAKVQNTKDWQHRMLKEMPSIKGHCGTTHRYRFDKEFYTQTGGRTPAIESDIEQLLRDRTTQLNELNMASFGTVPEYRLASNIKPLDTFGLDSLFSSLITSLEEGTINRSLLTTMNSITNTIATTGDRISAEKLGQYGDVLAEIGTLTLDIVESRDSYIESKETVAIMQSILHSSQNLWKFIKKMEGYATAPTKFRSIALEGERAKLLETARKSITLIPGREPAITSPYFSGAPGWESTMI